MTDLYHVIFQSFLIWALWNPSLYQLVSFKALKYRTLGLIVKVLFDLIIIIFS